MVSRATLAARGLAVVLLIFPQFASASAPSPVAAELIAAVAAATSTASPTSAAPLSSAPSIRRQDIIALAQPAVVRILTHFVGTTTVPAFNVNLETLTWGTGTKAAKPTPYDKDVSGSGFIVSPNGYIVTNSHVVSGATLRATLATQIAVATILGKALTLSAAESAKLKALGYTSAQYQKLTTDGIAYVMSHLPAITPTSITILKPEGFITATTTSALIIQLQGANLAVLEQQIGKLIQEGIPATVVSENDQYIDDQKDVAVLHVKETNLPAISLAKGASAQEGNPIYVFGFPSTADINGLNGPPSFTPGSVNALQDSTQHTFQYIQTDAKVSYGSSGGPLLDATGAAIGVLTLLTSARQGDSFAFALPIALVQQVLASDSIPIMAPSEYVDHILSGLSLAQAKHCKAADTEFMAALGVNQVFGSAAPYIQPYITSCMALIASGQSIDSRWDGIRIALEGLGVTFWLLLGVGVACIAGLIVALALFIRRMRKDETLIEGMVKNQSQVNVPPPLAAPLQTSSPPSSFPPPPTPPTTAL